MTETTTTAGTVPLTLEWLQAMAAAMSADPDKYRRLGTTDLRLGLHVERDGTGPEAAFVVTFEDYRCTAVDEVAAADLDRADCTLAAARSDWMDLVDHVTARGGADVAHTLNTLVLADETVHLRAPLQLGADAFYRFNATVQAFFEECANDRAKEHA